MPELPRTINLIPESPILNVPGTIPAIRAPHIRVLRVCRFVAVLHPVARLIDCAQAGIDADVWLRSGALAIFQELVGPKLIRFERAPCIVAPRGPLILRPDPILPVVSG